MKSREEEERKRQSGGERSERRENKAQEMPSEEKRQGTRGRLRMWKMGNLTGPPVVNKRRRAGRLREDCDI